MGEKTQCIVTYYDGSEYRAKRVVKTDDILVDSSAPHIWGLNPGVIIASVTVVEDLGREGTLITTYIDEVEVI